MWLAQGLVITVVLAALTPAPPSQKSDADPAKRPGIYAETPAGFVELTAYLEARQSIGGGLPVGGSEFVPSPGFAPQQIPRIIRFVVNASDATAEAALKGSMLRLHVIEGTQGRPSAAGFAQMSKRVFRLGVNLFEITSAELNEAWLRKTVKKLAGQENIETPVAFLEFLHRGVEGIAPRLYVVQIAL